MLKLFEDDLKSCALLHSAFLMVNYSYCTPAASRGSLAIARDDISIGGQRGERNGDSQTIYLPYIYFLTNRHFFPPTQDLRSSVIPMRQRGILWIMQE